MRKKIEKKTKKQNMSHYYWHSSLDHLGKQNKRNLILTKQTLEPNFYNDSVQIRKLTTICRRINRKSAVHSCLILSTKSSLTCFTTLYWQQLNIVRRMKFMKKKVFLKKEKVQTKIENQKHRNINQLHMFEFVWTTSLLLMFLDQSPCLIYLILPYYCESTHWIHKTKHKTSKP